MTLSVHLKEKPAVKPPETSAAVTGTTTEAPQSLKNGHWTAAEDAILKRYVEKYGEGNWNAVQKNLGLQRCGKSCRLRWANHLRPNLKKGAFSPEEEALIVQLHAQLGNKWARMALQLPGRTDNEIKNYWNTRIKRRQRVGLPLYPPEIQYQTALKNQKQGTLMLSQNQTQPKNFISHISPTTTTLFSNSSTRNNNPNCLLGNFNLNPLPQSQPQSQPQQLPSPTFSTKMMLPSTQLFSSCAGDPKLPPLPTPSIMSQENNVLFDDLYQKSQGPEELFDEGLFFEPLSISCITTAEPLTPSPQPSPTSIFNHSVVKPLYKLENSDIAIGTQVMKQPDETMIDQVGSNLAKINMTHTTVISTEKLLRDWCELRPSIGVTEQQLASTLSTTYDWNFESNSLENMHNIY